MKRFFALALSSFIFVSTAYTANKPKSIHHIPTIVDAIETVMTSPDPYLTIEDLPGFSKAYINACDDNGWTLLSAALHQGLTSLADQLKEHGARLGWSITHAIEHDNATALRPSLNTIQQEEHNHSVDVILFRHGVTPLAYALIRHKHKSVALLKEFNASLENAYLACIQHRSSTVFNDLYKNADVNESRVALSNIMHKGLFQPDATQLTNIRLTAGNQKTFDILQHVGEMHPELATSSKNYALAIKIITIELAIEHDSPKELVQALRINGAIVDLRDILQSALEKNAKKIVYHLTTTDKPLLIPLSKVALVIHRINEKLVVEYITTYMAEHSADESLQTIKALYLRAAQKQLHDITHECQKWLTEKVMSPTLETDNLELLKANLAQLESEQIHLELDVILGRALHENARAITAWLCQEKQILIDLNYAIELMDKDNSESAQVFLNSYIKHLQTVPMQEYGIALFILENQLGQKVQELQIPSLTQWYARTIVPLMQVPIEATQDAAQTVSKAQGRHASKQ